jgi:glycosyltransferase involved in cell wall biosynthesis
MIELTVLIPTYNRKAQLSKTLDALERQTRGDFFVVISDNASNYKIEEVLERRDPGFISRVTIFKRKTNIGADGNIINLFSICKTKWGWTLADDDFVYENAVENILNEIELNPGVGIFNFSVCNFDKLIPTRRVFTSLVEYIYFIYPLSKISHGDFIFLSNKVYNLEKLNEQLASMYEYLYTKIATAVLVLKTLESNIPYCITNMRIVEYENNGVNWSMEKVALGSRTIFDVKFDATPLLRKKILRVLAFDINQVYTVYCHQNLNTNKTYVFDQLYNGLYKYFLMTSHKCIFKVSSSLAKKTWGYCLLKYYYITLFPFMYSIYSLIKKSVRHA